MAVLVVVLNRIFVWNLSISNLLGLIAGPVAPLCSIKLSRGASSVVQRV